MFVHQGFLPSLFVGFATIASATHAATQYTLTTLVSFEGTNGSSPRAGVVFDTNGNLYGTTSHGGIMDVGTVFKLAPGNGVISTLVSFDLDNGINPIAGLIFDPSGNLYGTTLQGYGSGAKIFRVNPTSGTISTLVRFIGDNSGNLTDDLIFDSSGNLYGTSPTGGEGHGWVFRFDPVGGVLTKLASFNGDNGRAPHSKLIFDSSGKLYGTTSIFGPHGGGTVFRLDPTSGEITTVASFNGINGYASSAGVIIGTDGNLYGTTGLGGDSFDGISSFGHGTVFRLDPVSGALTTLASFNGTNGSSPEAELIFDSNGILYGTTSLGGEFGLGTVFRVDPASGELTTLISFDGPNGAVPSASLTFDLSGNLYGTTSGGGEFDHGTIFKLSPIVPGDFDDDGDIDGRDFLAWQRNPSIGDLADWQANYGMSSLVATSVSVPEPGSIGILLFSVAAIGAMRCCLFSELAFKQNRNPSSSSNFNLHHSK